MRPGLVNRALRRRAGATPHRLFSCFATCCTDAHVVLEQRGPAPPVDAPSRVTSQPYVVVMPAAAVLLAVVAMWARQPAFFSEPRFWAEEGRIFFARAWTAPWWQALTAAPILYFSL